ncbi:hypothetical protein BN7_5456 [Wickerhamomyces ciferrii]|uniref:Uncharacterized protein n=1 Tax=Wickerhamomyces ciferrii (strain ATCC 14091 / BCRC 22168 / CBS 111 / JCM 3599 / NBRC 0793 / NRRL Y-1031 F-60-10) TaxID=1206466 RepID=K0KWJ6_WICCF|nr:uncharacterized protein BN7_5456 [Wickerhamomyces ciferrii]CCH45869.1 hypothetical protein BN7_5456 [Wickerhamomyces ciferrii]
MIVNHSSIGVLSDTKRTLFIKFPRKPKLCSTNNDLTTVEFQYLFFNDEKCQINSRFIQDRFTSQMMLFTFFVKDSMYNGGNVLNVLLASRKLNYRDPGESQLRLIKNVTEMNSILKLNTEFFKNDPIELDLLKCYQSMFDNLKNHGIHAEIPIASYFHKEFLKADPCVSIIANSNELYRIFPNPEILKYKHVILNIFDIEKHVKVWSNTMRSKENANHEHLEKIANFSNFYDMITRPTFFKEAWIMTYINYKNSQISNSDNPDQRAIINYPKLIEAGNLKSYHLKGFYHIKEFISHPWSLNGPLTEELKDKSIDAALKQSESLKKIGIKIKEIERFQYDSSNDKFYFLWNAREIGIMKPDDIEILDFYGLKTALFNG